MLAEGVVALGVELGLDIGHRELEVPEGQDALAQRGADLLGWTPPGIGRQEYVCGGIFEGTEFAGHGVDRFGIDVEPARDGLGAEPFDIEDAQDFVPDVVGMFGVGEEVGGVRAWHGASPY